MFRSLRARCGGLVRGVVSTAALAACVVACGSTLHARPAATRLLPKSTKAFITIPDAAELKARAKETSMARMLRDEQVRPLVEDLYGSALQALSSVQERIGMPLAELLDIPQGELAFAIVPVKESRPALVVLMDIGPDPTRVNKLLEIGLERSREAGIEPQEVKVGETAITVLDLPGGDGSQQVMYFQREGTLVISSSAQVTSDLVKAWDAAAAEPLSANEAFSEIRERGRGPNDDPPQLAWFFDPVGLFKDLGEDNAGMKFAATFLGPLGLDGLRGLGGSVTLQTEQFEMIHRASVLMNAPRRGVVELIGFRPGDTVPETWVPQDAASYMTFTWDFQDTYEKLAKLVDSFGGEGTFSRRVNERFREDVGIDLEKEVLPYLAGRVSVASWIARPVTLTSQAGVYGFKLTDPKQVQPVIDKFAERYQDMLTKKTYGAITYYEFTPPGFEAPEGTASPPRPCFGILGDYLLIANQAAGLELASASFQDGTQLLSEVPSFRLIADEIRRQTGGADTAMISFQNPEESLRFIYELANSEQIRQNLRDGGETNEFLRALSEALENNPLPPFEVLTKYFAPSGSMLIDNEEGWQYIGFTLRSDLQDAEQ